MGEYVRYNVKRGAVCPLCDGALSVEMPVRTLFRTKKIRVLERANYCRHCGCKLRWVKNREE